MGAEARLGEGSLGIYLQLVQWSGDSRPRYRTTLRPLPTLGHERYPPSLIRRGGERALALPNSLSLSLPSRPYLRTLINRSEKQWRAEREREREEGFLLSLFDWISLRGGNRIGDQFRILWRHNDFDGFFFFLVDGKCSWKMIIVIEMLIWLELVSRIMENWRWNWKIIVVNVFFVPWTTLSRGAKIFSNRYLFYLLIFEFCIGSIISIY